MDNPLRANSPVSSDFAVLNPVEDNPAEAEPSKEIKELARAAKTKDGQIILDHLKAKVEEYTAIIKYTDLNSAQDNVLALATIMAAQKVVQEFEAVLRDVNIATNVVKDARK